METIVKSILFEEIIKAVMSKIITVIPVLGWPVINQIFSRVLYKVADMFYTELKTHSAFLQIDFEVETQRVEYDQATDDLRNVLSLPDVNEEEIQRAKDEYKKKLRDLIMLNAS